MFELSVKAWGVEKEELEREQELADSMGEQVALEERKWGAFQASSHPQDCSPGTSTVPEGDTTAARAYLDNSLSLEIKKAELGSHTY